MFLNMRIAEGVTHACLWRLQVGIYDGPFTPTVSLFMAW